LVSSTKNIDSVATAAVKDFEVSIANSGVQFRTVIDFQFRFFGIKQLPQNKCFILPKI